MAIRYALVATPMMQKPNWPQQTPREIRVADRDYPTRLSAAPCAPASIWVCGVLQNPARSVAVVGARAASARATQMAFELGAALSALGTEVISGGALGVDVAAHRGALSAGGRTVAVVGTGVDIAYPERHASLYNDVVQSGGAVLSQFPLGLGPRRHLFPLRNRVIAALADVVVVVEAGAESGSLYTAVAAHALCKPVIAVLGSPGTDGLHLAGAMSATSTAEILAVLAGETIAQPEVSATAAPVYLALDEKPREVGDISCRAGLDLTHCLSLLVELELSSHATRVAGGRYRRLR